VHDGASSHRYDPGALEATAVSVAEAAAELIRARIGEAIRIGAKSSPTDVVTQTDIDAEALIRELLAEATPAAGFQGEESGISAARAPLQWVVDPLDGTVNFLYSLPVIAVSIAAAVDGAIVAGAVADVVRGETFSAGSGGGARVEGRQIQVSSCSELAQALVTTGFSYRARIRSHQGDVVRRLLPEARDIRCFGSAALELSWVAAGRVDAYFERDIKLWDFAAGSLIAAEAGAVVELPCPENDGLVIAASPAVFDDLREIVQHDG
jgi:myo-inositol-1(or 4)-monophosphatase